MKTVALSDIKADFFEPLIGQDFSVRGVTGQDYKITFEKIILHSAVEPGQGGIPAGVRKQPFTLILFGSPEILEFQGSVTLTHSELGEFEPIFLVATHVQDSVKYFAADFS